MSNTPNTPTLAPADAWRDVWSDDREVTRVAAMRDLSDRIDDRYTADDYRSALARALAAES